MSRNEWNTTESGAPQSWDLRTRFPRRCSECAEAFGVSHDALAECLTHRTISVGGQALKANLNPADAEDCRDALAKHAYGALFRATVQRVNAALASASTKKGGVDYSIGALDIFGFEIFVRNSFEQLCINFCNEKLQQHFTKHTFDQEVAVYKAEGVPFAEIHYISNADVIELVEHRARGMFRMLDDEVRAPGGSDKQYRPAWNSSTRLQFARN